MSENHTLDTMLCLEERSVNLSSELRNNRSEENLSVSYKEVISAMTEKTGKVKVKEVSHFVLSINARNFGH